MGLLCVLNTDGAYITTGWTEVSMLLRLTHRGLTWAGMNPQATS